MFLFQKKYLSLIILGIVFEIFYILLWFLIIYKDALNDVSTPPRNDTILALFCIWVLGAVALYSYCIFSKYSKDNFPIIVFFLIVFSLTLIFTLPLGSADIYYYAYSARVLTKYFQNPYTTAIANFPNDIMASFFQWKPASIDTTSYGPLWTIISSIPNFIFQDSVQFVIYSYKIIAAIFNFGAALLIYKILEIINPQNKYHGLILYAFNPFILFEFVQNGHNDIMAIFFLLLAIYIFFKRKFLWVLPIFFLSVLVKYQLLIVFPLLIYMMKKESRHFVRDCLLALGISGIIIFVLFFPFWEGVKIFSPVFKMQMNRDILYYSIFPLILSSILHLTIQSIRIIAPFVFIIIYTYIFFWKRRSNETFIYIKKIFWVVFAFYSVAVLWLMPWYFTIIIALASMLYNKYYAYLAILITFISLSEYFLLFLVSIIIFFCVSFMAYLVSNYKKASIHKTAQSA